MVVWSRKRGESIVFRDDIVVTVTEIRDPKVTIKVRAPATVAIAGRPGEGREPLTFTLERDQTVEFSEGGMTVKLVEVRGEKCRLGLDAEREISIHRLEVYEAIGERAPYQDPSS